MTSKFKQLTEAQIQKLLDGDRLVLDFKAGRSVAYINHGVVERELKRARLRDGRTYTFAETRPAYKSGEGTILGYFIKVHEARNTDIPYEYFVIGEDLEGQLAQRK